MRVTVQHTLGMEDMPDYIESSLEAVTAKLQQVLETMHIASNEASAERFIGTSELVDEVRQAMTLIDVNLGEVQSLSLSYEKLRIEKSMPGIEGDSDE
jgi:hypothetical protein